MHYVKRNERTIRTCGSPKCYPPRVASILFSPKREPSHALPRGSNIDRAHILLTSVTRSCICETKAKSYHVCSLPLTSRKRRTHLLEYPCLQIVQPHGCACFLSNSI